MERFLVDFEPLRGPPGQQRHLRLVRIRGDQAAPVLDVVKPGDPDCRLGVTVTPEHRKKFRRAFAVFAAGRDGTIDEPTAMQLANWTEAAARKHLHLPAEKYLPAANPIERRA